MGIVLKNVNITGGKMVNQPYPTSGASGVTRSTATLMKTGQTTSFLTGDDGDLEAGRVTDWLTLDAAPLHNDGSTTINTTTNRFTDILGGQTYTDEIVLDWSTWNGSTLLGAQFDDFLLTGFTTLALQIAFVNTYTIGGFGGWKIPNFNELHVWMRKDFGVTPHALNYAPFNYTGVNIFSSSTFSTTNQVYAIRPDSQHLSGSVSTITNSSRPFPVRIFSLSTSNILS